MRQTKRNTSIQYGEGDGTQVEADRQLGNLLLENAIPLHKISQHEDFAQKSGGREFLAFLSVMIFLPILWAYKLTLGRFEEEDPYS